MESVWFFPMLFGAFVTTVVFLCVFSSDTWSRCWAVAYRALGKATRPSAGCFTAYKFTCSQLNSNRCSDIEQMHLNFIMVSVSLIIQGGNDKSNMVLFCFLFLLFRVISVHVLWFSCVSDDSFLLSEPHVTAMFQCLEAVEQNNPKLLAQVDTVGVGFTHFCVLIKIFVFFKNVNCSDKMKVLNADCETSSHEECHSSPLSLASPAVPPEGFTMCGSVEEPEPVCSAGIRWDLEERWRDSWRRLSEPQTRHVQLLSARSCRPKPQTYKHQHS